MRPHARPECVRTEIRDVSQLGWGGGGWEGNYAAAGAQRGSEWEVPRRTVGVGGAVGPAGAVHSTGSGASLHSHVRRGAPRGGSLIAGGLWGGGGRGSIGAYIPRLFPYCKNNVECEDGLSANSHVHHLARAEAGGGSNFTPHASLRCSGGGDRHEGDHDGQETRHWEISICPRGCFEHSHREVISERLALDR